MKSSQISAMQVNINSSSVRGATPPSAQYGIEESVERPQLEQVYAALMSAFVPLDLRL